MDTPEIFVSHHRRPPRYPPYSASPMAIPSAHDAVPPPLPPPRHIPDLGAGQDPGWQWGNDPSGADFGRAASVKPGSSLLGGFGQNFKQGKEHDERTHNDFDVRRGSSISTVTPVARDADMAEDNFLHNDEDSASRPSSNYRLHSERQLEQRSLEDSSQAYDKQLLSRIGGPNTPKRLSQSYSPQEAAQLAHAESERRNGQLRPLSMPERRQTSSDSPGSSRWPPSMPSSGAISPGFTGFFEHGPPENNRAQSRHPSLTFDDSASHRGSYDHSMFVHDDFPMEEGGMRELNINDRSPSGSEDFTLGAKAGVKRRASSPPREPTREERSSVGSASGHHDLYHRRSIQQFPNRNSPVSRFHPNHGSLSSTASSLGTRGSLGSSVGLSVSSIASSATSYASGRVSPGAMSPAIDPDLRVGTPYGGNKSMNPSPVASNPQHQRTFSESTQGGSRKMSVDSVQHSRQNSMSKMQGIYICECCPKKPKKFDTEDELKLHESEKQYTCAYCPNRFKNKNEAERHQNSLHLRRHSWSCAALAGVEAAFHPSPTTNLADICGYCGDEFSNPAQWDVRAEHLNHVHKFGECNQAKKFFRADHFRQHLKHSHAGTSGKWTNMLETACMKDEPPPEKRASPTLVVSTGGPAPTAPTMSAPGITSQTPKTGVIQETAHEE